MANIFTHFQATILSKPELAETTKPLTRKALERTEKETKDYDNWKDTPKLSQMLYYLSEECQKHQSSPRKTHDGVDFFSTSTTREFRMHPALTKFSDAHVKFLFDFLKERLVALNYKPVSSDTAVFKRGDYWIETIHRHVLISPNAKGCYGDNLVGDFGRLTIELLLKDDRLCALRFEATVPDTDLPRATDDFAQLIQLLPASPLNCFNHHFYFSKSSDLFPNRSFLFL